MVVSQSVVGRTNAEKPHGLVGMLKNPYVFMTCAFASLGCIMYGYDQGVMSPILVMENFQNHFPGLMGSTIQGWLVAALELGAWAGALFNGYLADQISRKYSMMVAVVVFTLGSGLQAGAQKPSYFFAGRIVGGLGIGMFSQVIPLYQAEIAPPELRGSLVSLQQLSITIGTAVAFWLDYGMQYVGGTTCNPEGIADPYLTDGSFDYERSNGHTCLGQKTVAWRFPLALQILFAWILFFGMFFFPFSPRWLMSKHREEEAVSALCKLRRLSPDDPLLKAEILEIKAAVMFDEESDQEAIEKGGRLAPWKALFAPNMFKRLVLGCGMMICQQFTGINAVLYYAPQIFKSFGFSSSTQTLLATGVTGILQIIFTLPAVLFLDKFGRKTFLIIGAAGMFCCHIVVATLQGIYEDDWALNEGLYKAQGWVAIAFIWLFAINFAYSWGPVTWVLAQEIFPNSARSRGVSIVASTNWMFNFVIGLTTKDMLGSMKYGTYIFFAIFSAIGGAFIWWFAPETKDKTLEELDIYFGGAQDSIAEADRARMARINEQLGLGGVERVEDLVVGPAINAPDPLPLVFLQTIYSSLLLSTFTFIHQTSWVGSTATLTSLAPTRSSRTWTTPTRSTRPSSPTSSSPAPLPSRPCAPTSTTARRTASPPATSTPRSSSPVSLVPSLTVRSSPRDWTLLTARRPSARPVSSSRMLPAATTTSLLIGLDSVYTIE